jgi:hypothetical protein
MGEEAELAELYEAIDAMLSLRFAGLLFSTPFSELQA